MTDHVTSAVIGDLHVQVRNFSVKFNHRVQHWKSPLRLSRRFRDVLHYLKQSFYWLIIFHRGTKIVAYKIYNRIFLNKTNNKINF